MSDPANKKIFNIEKEERNLSPEKLNDYIRIGSAGGILLIAAMVIAAAALIIWGFVGSIPVTITESVAVIGAAEKTNYCIGFVDVKKNTGRFRDGTEVNIQMPDGRRVKGSITQTAPTPLSVEEVREIYGEATNTELFITDWMLENLLGDSKYTYMYFIDTEEDISAYWHQMAEATIVTGEIKPISLLLR